jgi:hypothetical protein
MKSGKTTGRTEHLKAEGRISILICAIGLSVILSPLPSDAAATTIHVSPMSVNCGSVKAGGTSSPRYVKIKNTGKANLHINTVTSTDAEFSPSDECTDTDIAPGSVCIVTLTFSPPVESFGKKTATLEIHSTDAKKPVINVKLRGQAPPPKISVSSSPVNFGKIDIGSTSSSKSVTVRNTGMSDLNISAIAISGSDDFKEVASDCSVVAKGFSCTVDITFTHCLPVHRENASLIISSNDTKRPALSVGLIGRGGNITLVSVAVTPINSSIALGSPQQLTATATYSDGTSGNVTSQVAWSSSNTSFATVNNSGLATGVAAGSTTITATLCSISGSTTLTVTSEPLSNVMPVTVNGLLCSADSYPNKPCVSVTVCTPGTSDCQTIDDILLDTGSSGLRIFKQVLNVPLNPSDAGSIAECIQYADGSADWGPVQIADVILGNEPPVQVPIQVIDSTFGTPSVCGSPDEIDQSPDEAGFKGILGVGLFVQDCGQDCAAGGGNGTYYFICDDFSCQGTAVPLSSQVQNPVALLPKDNNGVIVELPDVPLGGVTSVDGYLVLGIGTEANNIPPVVKTYTVDQYGEFITIFNGDSNSSFIDTGSNGLFFPSPSSRVLPDCAFDSDWFCPPSTKSFSATNEGFSDSSSGKVSFDIGNFDKLTNSSYNVFAEIGGNDPGYFDWGLPFHFGRNIYVGLEGMESGLGIGPYWAY